jgi:hypothetical protein
VEIDMKTIIAGATLGLLLFGGNVYAAEDQEIVDPNSDLYDTSRSIEEAEYELTEDSGEKALLQDEYAGERLEETEVVLEEGDEEKADELMADYNESLQEIDQNIDAAKEAGEDVSDVEAIVTENSQKRSENLTALLDREDIPEEAKAGISKALENQQKAEQKFLEAQKKAEEARAKAEEKKEEAMKKAEEAKEKAEEKREEANERAEEKREAANEKAEQKREKAASKQKSETEEPTTNDDVEDEEEEEEGASRRP